MFWHPDHGLVTSHTVAQFIALPEGSCFASKSWSLCYRLAGHMELGKPYWTFPECEFTREQAAEVLAAYKRGDI